MHIHIEKTCHGVHVHTYICTYVHVCAYDVVRVIVPTEQDDDLWSMEEDTEESSSEDEAITSGKLTLEYFLKK